MPQRAQISDGSSRIVAAGRRRRERGTEFPQWSSSGASSVATPRILAEAGSALPKKPSTVRQQLLINVPGGPSALSLKELRERQVAIGRYNTLYKVRMLSEIAASVASPRPEVDIPLSSPRGLTGGTTPAAHLGLPLSRQGGGGYNGGGRSSPQLGSARGDSPRQQHRGRGIGRKRGGHFFRDLKEAEASWGEGQVAPFTRQPRLTLYESERRLAEMEARRVKIGGARADGSPRARGRAGRAGSRSARAWQWPVAYPAAARPITSFVDHMGRLTPMTATTRRLENVRGEVRGSVRTVLSPLPPLRF